MSNSCRGVGLCVPFFTFIGVFFASFVCAVELKTSVAIIYDDINSANDNDISGAGVLVSNDGHVLTADHVIPKQGIIYLRFGDGPLQTATAVERLKTHDLMLIKIQEPLQLPLPAKLGVSRSIASKLKEGNKIPVMGIGHPSRLGEQKKYSKFKSDIIELDSDKNIVVNESLYGGHSGGPLFDSDHLVIGIMSKTTTGMAKGGIAIPIDHAHTLFEQAGLFPYENTLHSYRSKIDSLNDEISLLKQQRERDKKALNWLLTYLEWKVEFCINEKKKRSLKIAYQKRFREQATPPADFFPTIRPLFDQASLKKDKMAHLEVTDNDSKFDSDGLFVLNNYPRSYTRQLKRLKKIDMESWDKIKELEIHQIMVNIEFDLGGDESSENTFPSIIRVIDYPPLELDSELTSCK